ncbi:MAG: geranylgeranyl reductase family protein [Candidatus Heimdallarchaeota archaeon]|nr:MAG: hypothetical protein DRO63_04315 [Candidatus Gerdarchaeota archaeon]RLI71001.1 MAG: hypothetical protein DRP02_06045 [Candidatus Gerdarchaeota archaeon]
MEKQITIIGAGPVGSLAAIHACSSGHTIQLLERREVIGSPDHCAGLLSRSGLAKVGFPSLPENVVQNKKIRGAKFYSPSGFCFEVHRSSVQAIVVDREKFDQYLTSLAVKRGANLLKSCAVRKVAYQNQKKLVRLSCYHAREKKTITIDSFVAILATGIHQRLLQSSALPTLNRKRFLSGYQLLMEGVVDLNVEQLELFFGNIFSPGFFAWIIPINDTTAKVGLASSHGESKKRLERLLYKNPLTKGRFQRAKVIKQYGGIVLDRCWLNKTVYPGIMIAGDAAGQTKATTGGGVIFGGLAGILAGKAAKAAVKEQNNSRKFLSERYETQWKALLIKQLRAMALFRWLLNRLNDKALDYAFQTVSAEGLNEIINREGDIDEQSQIIFKLLKQRTVHKLILKLLPHLTFFP